MLKHVLVHCEKIGGVGIGVHKVRRFYLNPWALNVFGIDNQEHKPQILNTSIQLE